MTLQRSSSAWMRSPCSDVAAPCRCCRRYWLAVGAQPTEKVAWILGRAGILPMPPQPPKFIPQKKEEKK